MFDLHISADVGAYKASLRWNPLCRVPIAFRAVAASAHREELWTSDVVRERFALRGGPAPRAGDPCFLQRYEVVLRADDNRR